MTCGKCIYSIDFDRYMCKCFNIESELNRKKLKKGRDACLKGKSSTLFMTKADIDNLKVSINEMEKWQNGREIR